MKGFEELKGFEAQPIEKAKTDESSKQSFFVSRLVEYETGTPLTKENDPLRAEDGSFLKHDQIREVFRSALESETLITNKSVIWHLQKYYVDDKLQELTTALKDKNESPKDGSVNSPVAQAREALIGEIKAIISNPEQFGYDQRYENTPRHELRYLNNEGQEDSYETLNALMADSEVVPDPLHISGRLPMPNTIADACKRLYEKWYPETEGDEMIARKLIKEKCIDQVVRELKVLEEGRDGVKRSFAQRERAIDEKAKMLTTLMRQLSLQEYMDHYVNMAAFGPYHEDANYPDDLLQLDTFYKRPPYNLTHEKDESADKVIKRVTFYRTVYENASKEDIADAVAAFDAGSTSFFRDAAGPISAANAYAKLELVFKEKGFTEEEIKTSCVGYISEVVDDMAKFEKNYTALHSQRDMVKDVAELRELNKTIAHMKNEGRGVLRKKMLTRAKQITDNIDFIRVAPIEYDKDLLAVLDGSETGVFEKESESVFAFDYKTLAERNARLDEYDRFKDSVNEHLQPSLGSEGANVAAQNDEYISSRDALSIKNNELKSILQAETVPDKAACVALVQEIEQHVTSMVDIINSSNLAQQESEDAE